jgi:hypothetical protein
MKKFKYLLIMLVALTVSVSCSDDNDDMGSNELVGTWGLSESDEGVAISIEATFNANFKGTIASTFSFGGESETDNSNFTWSTEGNKLTMIIDGDTEISTYSISGNKLTITDDDSDSFVLIRQ